MRDNEEISVGAEKVEKIERGDVGAEEMKRMQGAAANGGARSAEARRAKAAAKTAANAANGTRELSEKEIAQQKKIAREEARAEKRVAAAKLKEEKEEEKRVRAEQARADKMHRRAERAEREIRRREERDAGREEKGGKQPHAPGFGGWLAAVVSLSVAVLALGAIVTVGYFDLQETKGALAGGYQSSVYEFSELVENMDANLAKARITDGSYELQKVLTDVLVQSELAEKCLENFPVEGHSAESLVSFVNRVGDYSKSLLHKLAAGGTLTAQEEEVIEYMYQTVEKIRSNMPALIESAKGGTLEELLNETGDFNAEFGNLSNTTVEIPKSIEDGPFAQGAAKGDSELLSSAEELTESQAAERANGYFEEYKATEMRLTGKTQNGPFASYIFEFKDASGREFYAQITQRGGYLSVFDSYQPCSSHNYDVKTCVEIAGNFLEKCGYTGLRPVWASEAGVECCVNFAFEQDGAIVYPDMIKVKVCEERGIVTGLEAHSYLANHTQREIGQAKVSREKIEANASRRMQLHGVRLALIPVDGKEVLTYEIRGDFGGRRYYAYVDAATGETVEIFTVVSTDRGSALL